MTDSTEPSAYSFICENADCLAIMVIYPHPESPGLLDPFIRLAPVEDPMWDDHSPNCPNCGDSMSLDSSDPVSDRIVGSRGYYR